MSGRSLTRGSYTLFLFLLIFSPLAFGAVEQWSLTIMEGLSAAALLFLLGKPDEDGRALRDIPGTIPLLFLSFYCLLQLVPLPAGLVRAISPGTYDAYAEGLGLAGPLGWISLSLQKKATLREFFRFTSYFAFYVLTVQLLTRKELLRKTVKVVIVLSFLISLEAILQKILNNDRIYWIRKLTAGGTPFGPFVNRNHYAGFMEMVFPVVLAVFLYYKPRVSYGTFRERISDLLQRSRTNIYILAGFAALLVATSVFLALSRSGIVSLCIAMLFFGIMLATMKRNRQRGMVIVVLFSLIVVSVGWFGWAPIFGRFSRVMDAGGNLNDLRPTIWKDSLNMIRDFPVTGTGFGSFFAAYPKYRTWSGPTLFTDHAHSDYIELLTEGGVVAFLLSGWFLAILIVKSYGKFRLRKDPYSVYLFLGSLTGMAALLVHSVTDFNLHIGSNGLYFFFLAGLAVSAANTRFREGTGSDTYLEKLSGRRLAVLRVFFAIVLVSGLLFNGGILIGRFFSSRAADVKLDRSAEGDTLRAAARFLGQASLFDPLEPSYHSNEGNAEMLLGHPGKAFPEFVQAAGLEPMNGEYLQRLGLACSALKDYDRASRLLEAGVKAGGGSPFYYRTYASWLFSRGDRKGGMVNMRHAIAMEPERTRDYIAVLVMYGLDDEDIGIALPDMAGPHLVFADYLEKTGKEDRAGAEYTKAMGYETANPSSFLQACRYYLKRGDYDSAITVMRRAVAVLPDNAGLRVAAGDAYERAGIKYRAVEEYRRALMIEPGNTGAAAKLKELEAGG